MTFTIFLDFDGVLHPDPCSKENFFSQLPLFEQVLREFIQAEVVISSSWRFDHSLDELKAFFSADLQSRVIGVTPTVSRTDHEGWIPPHLLRYHREWECRKWMREHRNTNAKWLALDDMPAWFTDGCSNLLTTQSDYGIQEIELGTLRLALHAHRSE